MHQDNDREASTEERKRNLMTILKSRVMKIVLNFLNNEVSGVLCLYLVNICLTFSILYIYILML